MVKYVFKVNKITLEQRSLERCSNVIFLTLNKYLLTDIMTYNNHNLGQGTFIKSQLY